MDKKTIKHERINIIGVGGVGSILVDLLHSLEFKRVNLIDFDQVEKKNLKRQNFSEEHIGMYKAEVLAERYKYEFQNEYYTGDERLSGIIVSCVDNNKSRVAIKNQSNIIKIFCANETKDAEAYIGCKETYELNKNAFIEEEHVEKVHCTDEEVDPQTKVANMTAAIMAINLILNINKKLLKEDICPIMIRSCGQIFNTIRLGDIRCTT